MRVHQLGDGDPDVAVVAAVHGDEPCGERAVARLLADPPVVSRPVKLVVANELASDRDDRYVDEDLNRAFPGDPAATSHEARLAAALERELDGCTTLALHSTQSYGDPFALVDAVGEETGAICAALSIDAVVETGPFADGRLISYPRTVEVECGYQGSDSAADNAFRLVREFLGATGVLPASSTPRDVPVFRFTERVSKPAGREEYEVFAENFERVAEGETFAAADGDPWVAKEEFYPVLMSPYGYERVFGYAGERVGSVSAAGPGVSAGD
ncbi:succinylglutamate desuccinylase/aspartoacylase family protein [Haloplanus sp. GCM10025708]|uniref:succinylglutamate desuccinylase/aspartoacylase domain-containing protein n=1 Tax=Haloferacaceae TaxID=1644056 RepID=UPI00361CF566